MDILYVILALICAFIGIIGSVVPILPGPPIGYVSLVLVYICDYTSFPTWALIVMGVLMVVVTVFDFIAPSWMTKAEGGSKSASRGAMIGLVAGLFDPFISPWGIIVGPFVGAFLGELIAKSSKGKAFKVALMSFYAFLLTSGIKLIYGIVVLVIVIFALIDVVCAYWNILFD